LARWAGLPKKRPRRPVAAPAPAPPAELAPAVALVLELDDVLLLPQAAMTSAAITAPSTNELRRMWLTDMFI
jgi:hypothetical protein